MKECGYCGSRAVLPLNGKYYCEECEVYYTYKNSVQEYSNLPIEEADQMTVGDRLCERCRPAYSGKRVVPCTTFREYLRKLPLCSGCKKSNERCIKNAFFKSFILHRTYERVFSMRSIALHTVWFYLMGGSVAYRLVVVNLIAWRRRRPRVWRLLLQSVLVAASGLLGWGGMLCYLYSLAMMMQGRRWCYRVPVNLDSPPPNILQYLEHLSIGRPEKRSQTGP